MKTIICLQYTNVNNELPCIIFPTLGETAGCAKISVIVCSSLATFENCVWLLNSNKLGEHST